MTESNSKKIKEKTEIANEQKESSKQKEVVNLVPEGSVRYINQNLFYMQLSLFLSVAILILLLITPKSTFMANYSAILSIGATLFSTSLVISTSLKKKITEIEYLILNSAIGVLGSFFCGLFLLKANFLPPNYLILSVLPGFYYYLLSVLIFLLGTFSMAYFIKTSYEWIIHYKELQESTNQEK